MDQEIKDILSHLIAEIRKDWKFFGACGALVGYFFLIEDSLRKAGVATGSESWAKGLLSDFISLNAFGLVYLGLIAMGAVATICSHFGRRWQKLELTVQHIEARLAQIASSMISFTFGISALMLSRSLFIITLDGPKLALLIVLFNFMLLGAFVIASVVARRIKPFDTWWIAAIMFCFAAFAGSWVMVKGPK